MKTRDSIYLAIILVLLGLVVYLGATNPKSVSIVKTKIDTLIVTNDTTIYKKKLVPYRVDSIVRDSIVIPDTLLAEKYLDLAKKYRATKYYSDTIYKDSLSSVTLSEQCTSNEIRNRVVRASIGTKIIKSTTTIERDNYYNGIGIGAIVDANTISPSLLYSTKNLVYLGGYDVVNKEVKVGLFYKFNFRK